MKTRLGVASLFQAPTFMRGVVTNYASPEGLAEALFVDPRQFSFICAAGASVVLDLAPTSVVQQASGLQFATGLFSN